MDDDETPWWTVPPERDDPAVPEAPEPAARTPLRAPAAPPHRYLPRPAAPPAAPVRVPDVAPGAGVVPAAPVDREPPTERLEHPGLLRRSPDETPTRADPPAPDAATPDAPAAHVPAADPPARDLPAAADATDGIADDVIVDDVIVDDAAEMAPPPPPRARPAVRRVAVVPPEPPPGPVHDSREPAPSFGGPADRTEKLPQIPDEIFATFSGPGGPDPVPGAGRDHGPEEPGAVATRRRTGTPGRGLNLPKALNAVDRQSALFGAVGVVLVVVLVVLLSKVGLFGGGDDPAPQASATATPRTAAVGDFSARRPDGLSKVDEGQATSLLAQAKQSGKGSVVEAWTWNDRNGKNLVVTLQDPAPGGHVTLRVVHVAGLDGDAETLRVMEDPELPRGCPGTAAFTPGSLQVADLDGDDVAEVAAGWQSKCRGAAASDVRLALITNGDKYIVRGNGVVGQSGSAEPDPDKGAWPRGYANALGKLFGKLYYKP